MNDPLPNIPHQPPRTEQEQEASFEKHGDNHYLRFVHMAAFAARLEAESWVPGIMHCSKCLFSLQRITLFVRSGTAGAGNHEPEDCPNRCGPMAPMTWKLRSEQNSELLEQQFERTRGLEVALRELVTLKDLKDEESRLRQRRIVAINNDQEAVGEVDAMRDDYNRRKPLAWDAARAILGPKP